MINEIESHLRYLEKDEYLSSASEIIYNDSIINVAVIV